MRFKGGSVAGASEREDGLQLRWGRGPTAALLLALASCAGPGSDSSADPALDVCRSAYTLVDRVVERAGVRDAEAYRPRGYPWLRSSRFLASFRDRSLSDDAFEAWLDRMIALDREGRTVELMNLPGDARRALGARLRAADVQDDWLTDCPPRFRDAVMASAGARQALRRAVAVPDDYDAFARTLGLYPLTAVPVALGYERWKAGALPAFAVPFGEEALEGARVLYRPDLDGPAASAAEVAALLERAAARDPLAIPDLGPDELARLALAFAPVLLVDVAGDHDRVGTPRWRPDGLPEVDARRPTAFVRLEHAWLDDEPIAQLVYLFWFDARPRQGVVDLLAGRLDGLVWRVSLRPAGRPFVYDTIHPCGCYHLFFPAPGVRRLPVPEDAPGDPREAPLVPAAVEVRAPEERTLVRVAAVSHYVTGVGRLSDVEASRAEVRDYAMVIEPIPDLALRSMPTPGGGRRSLYGPEGLIAGTERDERVVLWPMGIAEPGAMRQWGRHATAFVGERHFDDPHLLERTFGR